MTTNTRMKPGKKLPGKARGLLLLTAYLLLIPLSAHAGIYGSLNKFLQYLTGDIGKSISALAIVGGGFACLGLGKLPKMYFAAIVIGVVIIFGAPEILSVVTG